MRDETDPTVLPYLLQPYAARTIKFPYLIPLGILYVQGLAVRPATLGFAQYTEPER